MRSGKLAFLDTLLADAGGMSSSVVMAVRRWLYLRRFRNAAIAVRASTILARTLRGLRALYRFRRLVRVRLMLARALVPRLNRIRARLHNRELTRRAAAKAQAVKDEFARAVAVQREATLVADQSKQRQLFDVKSLEDDLQKGFAERVSALVQLHASMNERVQAATAAAMRATAACEQEARARAAAEARVAALELSSAHDAVTIKGLRAQLADQARQTHDEHQRMQADMQVGRDTAAAAEAHAHAVQEQLSAKLDESVRERKELAARLAQVTVELETCKVIIATPPPAPPPPPPAPPSLDGALAAAEGRVLELQQIAAAAETLRAEQATVASGLQTRITQLEDQLIKLGMERRQSKWLEANLST